MQAEAKLKKLRREQEQLTQRMSVLVLQSIFIFGVPAVLGYFAGVYLENTGVVKVFAYILPLVLTFAFSWFVLLTKLNRLKREVEKVESEIQHLAPPKAEENKEEEGGDDDLK